MSLTNRLSLYFLAALGVVLLGFSGILYTLAHRHLHARADHRLDAAMQTLVAAVEVHPSDVEWEPLERRITTGGDPGPDQLRWTVHDPAGRLIDCSGNLEAADPAPSGDWRLLVRRVRAGKFDPEALDGQEGPFVGGLAGAVPGGQIPGTVNLPHDRFFHGDALILTVGVSEGPIRASLAQLGWTLAAVSGLVWLTAALWGRWLCRRALRPITRMAASAREIRSRPGGAFLDVAHTADELEDLGRAFNELLAALGESLERQRRFTGDASHQLRTPLTALLAGVEVALRHERPAAEYRQVLGVVLRRGAQLHRIIESLLFLARCEAALPFDLEPLDLADCVRGRLAEWFDHPRAADIALDVPERPVPVLAHAGLVGQLLDNLVDNACKYSPPGTPIRIRLETAAGAARLTVEDRGIGLDPADLPHLGEPFFRPVAVRQRGVPGVGLGLAVVRRIATTLGGAFTAGGTSGEGSWFSLVLPLTSPYLSDAGDGASGLGSPSPSSQRIGAQV